MAVKPRVVIGSAVFIGALAAGGISYAAAQTTSTTHASTVRQSQNATIEHNTLWCSVNDVAPDGGCSANLTGYGDFEPCGCREPCRGT